MTMQEEYLALLERHKALERSPMGRFHLNQERRYVEPFNIYGPIWYVGDDWVCVHLIDTGDGLLLIDSGNYGATAVLVHSIWRAGFDPSDVRWIIHSHGHVDHIGGSLFFQRMFGTKLYLSDADAKVFRETPWLSLMQESRNDCEDLFTPDVEIHDGETIAFGNIPIRFVLCPGHTIGVISCFFDVDGEEGVKRCGYFGGFGFNTLRKDYLQEIGDSDFSMRERYLDSLAKVRDEKVELFLGNHPNNNNTFEKQASRQTSQGKNPFLNSEEWQSYLDQKREELLRFMADPANN